MFPLANQTVIHNAEGNGRIIRVSRGSAIVRFDSGRTIKVRNALGQLAREGSSWRLHASVNGALA